LTAVTTDALFHAAREPLSPTLDDHARAILSRAFQAKVRRGIPWNQGVDSAREADAPGAALMVQRAQSSEAPMNTPP
jgi:hypothetical protein